MSNGTRSCPSVTLPFGVFAGTNTIDPLDPTELPPADPPPGLEQFIIDNAPTDATPLDGFDQAFLETAGIVDALDSALGSLEGELLLAFGEADTIDAGPVGYTVAGFTAALAPTSTAADNLGTLLSTAAAPIPPAPPAPSDVLGSFQFGDVWSALLPCTVDVPFTNISAVPDAIIGISLTNNTADVFSARLASTAPVPQGGTVTIHFTINPAPVGAYVVDFAITTANESRPAGGKLYVNIVSHVTPPCAPQGRSGGLPGGGGGPIRPVQ